MCCVFFFFKQNTAYEMRISDWSSDVCSSVLVADPLVGLLITIAIVQIVWQSSRVVFTRMLDGVEPHIIEALRETASHAGGVEKVTEVRARWVEIGRASCRERVCQYV